MADRTKTVVLVESHERTVVRRTRRAVSVRGGQTAELPPERTGRKRSAGLCMWWRALARKGAAVLAPLSRRLKYGGARDKGRS